MLLSTELIQTTDQDNRGDNMSDELLHKLVYLIKKKRSLAEVCKELDLKDYEVIGLTKLLNEKGYLVDYVNGELVKLKTPPKHDDIYEVQTPEDYIKLCLISDTHLCSKYDRIDLLNYIYEKAGARGIKYILHSGDFTDGKSTRPEHIYELKEHSLKGQIDYCVENYPSVEGITTYCISGNHDDWWYKSTGSEIVKMIADRRDDIVYLGPDCADMKIGKLKIRLYHGKSGQAYARSYKIQKYLDTIPVHELPGILQTGHIHQAFYMKQDNTHCFQTSCLEDETPYTRAMGLANDKSIWWVEAGIDKNGTIQEIKTELECFGPRLAKRRRK